MMIIYGVIFLLILVGAFLAYCSMKPNEFRVERTVTINAPAEKMFPMINDFHQWVQWSPYEKMDTTMKKTFSGAEKGKGAIYEWAGNKKVGEGRMEILDTTSPSSVKLSLDFYKPMQFHNKGEFILKPNGDSTDVTWAMFGPQPFMGKVMGTFINMDKLIGKDFEAGLANMKQIAEK